MPSPKPATRVLVSASILLAGSLAIWAFVAFRPAPAGGPGGAGVRLVDTRAELGELLAQRARAVAMGELPALDALGRLPIDEELALKFHPALEESSRNAYDPLAYYVPRPHFRSMRRFREHPAQEWEVATDARGFRRPGESSAARPDLRVLVVGDSHVEGVMPVEETLTMRLEGLLRGRFGEGRTIEVLNGSRGGYAFYNYLGALERNLDLRPHVFVMVVFGGNDFAGFLPMHLYFKGLELPGAGEGWPNDLMLAQRMYGQAISQSHHQLGYFARAPEALELALEGSVEVALAAARLCGEHGIRFVCAYLPPLPDIEHERERVREELDLIEQILALRPEEIESTDRLADRFLAALEARGIETLDLRPVLNGNPEPLYWRVDHHLSTRGHELVAQVLYEHLVEGL